MFQNSKVIKVCVTYGIVPSRESMTEVPILGLSKHKKCRNMKKKKLN